MYKLTLYVPETHLESVKQALFAAGAGRIGHYQQCCWQVKGLGQFCAMAEAQPFIGEIGRLEQVDEWRVEMVLSDLYREAVIAALLDAHPYETPAFDLVKVETS